jgi:hypothetical protein
MSSSAASIVEGGVTSGIGNGSVDLIASLKDVVIFPSMHKIASPVRGLFGVGPGKSGEILLVSRSGATTSVSVLFAVSAPVLAP